MPVVSVRSFAPLMTQRVRIAQFTGYDSYGAPAFGSDVTYQCAVVGEMKLVRNAQGQEVPSQHSVYIMSNLALQPADRVTLSTQDVDSTEQAALSPPIIGVGRYPFLRGQFCTVAYLGRTGGIGQ